MQEPGSDTKWLSRMRWGVVAIASATLVAASRSGSLGVDHTVWMWSCIGVAALSNLWLQGRGSTANGRAAYLLLDVALLTVLLALSGGPMNPFSVMYLVFIALSSVMSQQRWTWLVALASIAAFALLFAVDGGGMTSMPHAMDGAHDAHEAGALRSHLYGMFVAFVIAAVLIAYFVGRLSNAVRQREAALQEATHRAEQWSKLAAIASVAANTAHEIGSPLTTIAVAAGEMKRHMLAEGTEELVGDVELIRQEVRRCRDALDRFAAASGDPAGEAPSWVNVETLVQGVRSRLRIEDAERWQVSASLDRIHVPELAFTQVLANLVQNAFDACSEGSVRIAIDASNGRAVLRLTDEGTGMDAQTAARASEPFFSSKERPDRIGLGLFVAKSLVEALHGSLSIDSQPGQGTVVNLSLPQPS